MMNSLLSLQADSQTDFISPQANASDYIITNSHNVVVLIYVFIVSVVKVV